jgi:hypothetical protein
MLRLELAQFDPADAQLTDAGACGPCVYRTGNQASLFGDVKGADVCTNPPCHAKKTKASWELRAVTAAAAGVKVLDKEASQKVFNAYGDPRKVVHGAPYVDPKAEVPHEINPTSKSVTWRIGSDLPYAETVSRGSKPHTIRARNVRFMTFKWDRGDLSPRLRRRKWRGKFLFRKVYHPGNKRPRRFLTTPLAMYARRSNFKVTYVGVTRGFLP